jgi:branched-chain amino acid transport system permease protein
LPRPEALSQSLRIGPMVFPSYRLFVIAIGAVIGVALWLLQEKTKLGAMIRAAIDDAEIARATGINVSLLSTAVFALGAALAAAGGVIAGPLLGVYPGADFEILLLAFVVVIVGGLGSLKGAFFGALLVGLLDNFGKALFPELALFTIFAPMAFILAVRPTGLFGAR